VNLGQPGLVEADITAQLAALIVADEEIDDPRLGLRLQGERAVRVSASDRMRAIGAG
jgi:hypothetical protein